MQVQKTYFNWSTGKDASLALYKLQQRPEFNIDLLVTSINAHHNRVSMHGLRRSLLEKQAAAIGLPLRTIELPEEPTMEVYAAKMTETVTALKAEGYTTTGFGDIFLEDLRTYREQQLQPFDIQCQFPLWKQDTKKILQEMLSLGFRTIVICVKAEFLDETFVGREIDQNFINDLPGNVDPCGEHGEFHTFCFDGPIFKHPIGFEIGEKIYREYKRPKGDASSEKDMGFWFCDLIYKSDL